MSGQFWFYTWFFHRTCRRGIVYFTREPEVLPPANFRKASGLAKQDDGIIDEKFRRNGVRMTNLRLQRNETWRINVHGDDECHRGRGDANVPVVRGGASGNEVRREDRSERAH